MTKRKSLAVAAFLMLLLSWYFLPSGPDVAEPEDVTVLVSSDEFGIPIDVYRVVEGRIGRNQTFSDLLNPFSISYQEIVNIAAKTRKIFDVRKLRSGQPFRVYLDSLDVPEFLVYSVDRRTFVTFDTRNEYSATISDRPVEIRPRVVTGVINQSLYQTLVDQDISPELAIRLSEIYAWQIDFYRIQKNDSFKIIFEEAWIGNERVGIADVKAARFNHFGNAYYAFHFQDGDVDEYYDEEGKSLRKAFLVAPVKYSRISSGYSGRRFHPVTKRYKAHLGTDYVAPQGTPIRATGDGVVLEARYRKFNGNWVKIRHNGTYSTGYLHMSRIARGIRAGVRVKQGQVIGYVGHTGLATGNHVCYRFWKNNRQVNHRREKFPSVGPVPAKYETTFASVRDGYLDDLSSMSEIPNAESYALVLSNPGRATP
jgi:murein DD-endopeptidase MepM/ murein hydrolase activator NlpD